MRRRQRVLIAIGALFVIALIAYLLMPLPAFNYLAPSGIRSDTKYCEHRITDRVRVRLAYVSYIGAMLATWGIDPNHWEDHGMSGEFMPHQAVRIPYFDYEVTRDGSNTWEKFWAYENWENRYPRCERFDKLDTDTFWVWTLYGFAVTHDSGLSWITHDFCPEQGQWILREFKIDTLGFQSGERGIVSQIDGKPDLVTTDGGRTWQPDTSRVTPTADLNQTRRTLCQSHVRKFYAAFRHSAATARRLSVRARGPDSPPSSPKWAART